MTAHNVEIRDRGRSSTAPTVCLIPVFRCGAFRHSAPEIRLRLELTLPLLTRQGCRNPADVWSFVQSPNNLNDRLRLCSGPLRKLGAAPELVRFLFVAHRICGMPLCTVCTAG